MLEAVGAELVMEHHLVEMEILVELEEMAVAGLVHLVLHLLLLLELQIQAVAEAVQKAVKLQLLAVQVLLF
jgi:hypothetical protein